MIERVERPGSSENPKPVQGAIKGHRAEVLKGEKNPAEVPKTNYHGSGTKRKIEADTKIPNPKEAKATARIFQARRPGA